MDKRKINIGWAETDITPQRPVMLFGQMYKRVSQYVKEPLKGTALVIENGEEQAVLVSLDITVPPETIMEEVKSRLTDIEGLDAGKIIVFVTHTHNAYDFGAPSLFPHEEMLPRDIQASVSTPPDVMTHGEGNAFLTEKIVELVKSAWAGRKAGSISCASDYAAVGFNRRSVFRQQDGQDESVMYGAASKSNFRRFEGTVDHSAEMLYTWDTEGSITGVLINIPCPSQVYELHCFISSDYWHEVRDQLRKKLGDIFILPMCGAAGDQNPLDLVQISKHNERELELWNEQAGEVSRNIDMKDECVRIGERICDAVTRGLKRAGNNLQDEVILKHLVETIEFSIRQVEEAEAIEAKRMVESYIGQFSPENKMRPEDMVKMFEPCGVIKRWEQQCQSKKARFEFHVIRIGDTVIVTNPFELFVEYGLRIKARAKSNQTILVQLADVCGGYLPTEAAVMGGSYSSKPASTLCGADSGDLLCERLIEKIALLFK
jgi:hypothetical protein